MIYIVPKMIGIKNFEESSKTDQFYRGIFAGNIAYVLLLTTALDNLRSCYNLLVVQI